MLPRVSRTCWRNSIYLRMLTVYPYHFQEIMKSSSYLIPLLNTDNIPTIFLLRKIYQFSKLPVHKTVVKGLRGSHRQTVDNSFHNVIINIAFFKA